MMILKEVEQFGTWQIITAFGKNSWVAWARLNADSKDDSVDLEPVYYETDIVSRDAAIIRMKQKLRFLCR